MEAKKAVTEGTNATSKIDWKGLRVSGPFTHENLTVFIVCSGTPDERDFLTLDEGLRSGAVTIAEKSGGAQVRELEIENTSDLPLFIQEGDRLKGGQQDRTVYSSLVVPAKSGKMPIPTFCIEPSRWTGKRGFTAAGNDTLADKEVRYAAKVDKDQGKVWHEVEESRKAVAKMTKADSAAYGTSSLNEALDSEDVRKASEGYTKALEGVLKDKKDAVGIAIVVNGKIEEVDLYPGPKLLAKLYPRLLSSYGIRAATRRDGAKDAKAPTPDDVVRFAKDGEGRALRSERIDNRNSLGVVDYRDKVECDTTYDGKRVHHQVLAK